MAAAPREIFRLNTNLRKLKWLLLEMEMPLKNVAKMLQQLLGLKELPKTSIVLMD
jgi:hypothetical protein